MLEDIEKKVAWLFIILPGFISVTIIGMMIDIGQLSEFQIGFYSLVLTLVTLAIVMFVFWLLELRYDRKSKGMMVAFVILTLVVSVILGVGIGLAAERDTFFVVLRSLPITDTLNKRSSSRPLVFLLAQNSAGLLKQEGDGRPKGQKVTEAWVRIRMKGGHIFEGWPEFFPVTKDSAEMYLSPACEIMNEKGSIKIMPIAGPGVLLFEREMESFVFLDRDSSPCFDHWLGSKASSGNP